MYRYPDVDDHVTATYQVRTEPYPGYWSRSEGYALSHALRETVGMRRGLLDVGCGRGRLIPMFAHHFDRVVAIEPDPARASEARRVVRQAGIGHAEVVEGGLEAVPGAAAPFDVVLCSHVIQHVRTTDAPRILAGIERLLAPRGRLLLLVPRVRGGSERFIASRVREGRVVSRELSAPEFDELIMNDGGDLPVRLFSRPVLDRLLAPHFVLQKIRVYSDMSPARWLDGLIFRDRLINLPILRDRFGDNLLLVAEHIGG